MLSEVRGSVATKDESKHPDIASRAMPHQGILPRSSGAMRLTAPAACPKALQRSALPRDVPSRAGAQNNGPWHPQFRRAGEGSAPLLPRVPTPNRLASETSIRARLSLVHHAPAPESANEPGAEVPGNDSYKETSPVGCDT